MKQLISIASIMFATVGNVISQPHNERSVSPPPSPSGVVKSLNGLSGQVTISAGTNVTITREGNCLQISTTPSSGGNGGADWSRSGNVAAPGEFLGTLNEAPLELKVGGARAMRLEWGLGLSPNLIGGNTSNHVSAGAVGATIGGGGSSVAPNAVTDHAGTVGGGGGNRAGYYGFVGGGSQNLSQGTASSIGGGEYNSALTNHAVVGGGQFNFSYGICASVGGGSQNSAGDYGCVGGGSGNRSVEYGTVGGGLQNFAFGAWDAIGGGEGNYSSGGLNTISGGFHNTNTGGASVISGGELNRIAGFGFQGVIGGGALNISAGPQSVIGGGFRNTNSGTNSVIGGGYSNTTDGWGSVVPGGIGNTALGEGSFAAGTLAKAGHRGAFVWADSGIAELASSSTNQFTARASGGVRFYSADNLSAGVQLAPGAGAWSTLSDRHVKENVKSVDGGDVLDRLAKLPIQTWNLKTQNPAIRHIGAMAQDFYAAFGVGEDDKHINTVDADGVALAAIQGLRQLVQEKDASISRLEKRIERLEALLRSLPHAGHCLSNCSRRSPMMR